MFNFKSFGKKSPKEGESAAKTITEGIGGFTQDISSTLNNLSPQDRKEAGQKLDQVQTVLVSALVFLSPLFVFPIVMDWFELPRVVLLLIGGLIGLALFFLKNLLTQKTVLTRSILDFPILLLVVAAFVSAFLSINRVTAVTSDTLTIGSGALIFFLIVQSVKNRQGIANLARLMVLSGGLLGLWSIVQLAYQLLSPILKLNLNLVYLSPSFSLTGSPLSQAMFLIALLPIAFSLYNKSGEEKSESNGLFTISFLCIVLGTVVTLYSVFINRPIILDTTTAWRVATGTLGESLSHAFFGTGPGHYVDAFTTYKTADFNNGPYWNLRFSTSSNYYFYLLTTLGIAGLATFVFLITRFLQIARKRFDATVGGNLEKGIISSVGLILLGLVFLPAPTVVVVLLFALLGLLIGTYKVGEIDAFAKTVTVERLHSLGARIATLSLSLALLLVSLYYLGSFVLADYYFARSISALNQNRGGDAYNLQIQAATLNPWNDTYRATYSQTNLALANALAGQANISDQQKSAIVQLVQQSIREARVAAALEPRRAANWENLSLIYRNLINFAQGSDQWAVASQNQAIALDPNNPRLRLDLGGIYYSLKDYQSAGQIYVQAVSLKPDLANSHYNLAQVLVQLNLKDQAAQQLQLTASLVCANGQSADCTRVQADLASLTNNPTVAGASTQAAQVTPTPVVESPLATPGAKNLNLPKAKTQPPAKISSPGGELTP